MPNGGGHAKAVGAKAIRTQAGSDERPARPRRLEPEARARMILEGAISFFAEHGFDGQIRDLAQTLGVSQALIFTYFGNKQTLLERVYDEVYIARWKDDWIAQIQDRSQPIEERLVAFYTDYLAAIDEPIWIKIVLHSGLAGNELTPRYVSRRVEAILLAILQELRHEYPRILTDVAHDTLYERVWDLQSSFIYTLVRKHVWHLPVRMTDEQLIQQRVRQFLFGLGAFEITAPTT